MALEGPISKGRVASLASLGLTEAAQAAPGLGATGHAERAAESVRHDIETFGDCELLVRSFYERAMADPVIGWLFTDVAKLDLEAHLPRMYCFWETLLLGANNYGSGAYQAHAALNAKAELKHGHFERWLHLWHGTVDEFFEGECAERAKAHATRIAAAYQRRLRAAEARDAAAARQSPAAPARAAAPLSLVHQG